MASHGGMREGSGRPAGAVNKATSELNKPTKEEGGFKEKGDFMYHGDHNTDFEHLGCGGTFYEKADNVRLNCKSESRFYKPNGVFIESYFED